MPRRKKSTLRTNTVGVGIDLINLSRIKRFIKENSASDLRRLLTPRESLSYGSRKLSVMQLAKMLAAKEAFFKACGCSWMGLEGFSSIEVKCLPQSRFRVKSTNSKFYAGAEGAGCFFRSENLIGAQVILNHAVVTT